ncbi:MAG: coenzyme Q-binding protein COQ10 [Paracoccaceae bacterium]|jgi:coenzyme Q-binding protein COQ10
MPKHSEIRTMSYSAKQMFDLVADVSQYPEFLPWCAAARIRSSTMGDTQTVIDADLVISFKVFREKFGSTVTLTPNENRIDVVYLDGPFKYLNNHWLFKDIGDGQCEAAFFVDFEFKSVVLQAVIGVVFGEAMERIVRAFERRAQDLYG